MSDKEKKKRYTEIEHPDIREIEHTTTHPDSERYSSLQDVNYSPGENNYLSEHTSGQS
ncbi:hypothetical protein [Tuberibacillus sp. Marseille-P3662]|uniref:hypothetical protein n=1 Tax=Tuberibacillus sp. Marseille-P3662 TaxID=1965358 RepID=UPI001593956B|nr:hypothetical protein [Tuberibacillus sp. Marseille-P3662]